MVDYTPLRRKGGSQKTPWGYFLHPNDNTMFIPDKEKLDALHYAFRMRARHQTSYSMCAKWLHQTTGRSITAGGFCILYHRWCKLMKKHHQRRLDTEFKEKISHMKELTVSLYDPADITALAHEAARKAWKKEQQG